ncbi:MAG TPA: hypothetical protein VKU00_31485 [Chthonomonadaceae bacterium]|nr:hypothetical protein [Chthonomonadaceae bacterium]
MPRKKQITEIQSKADHRNMELNYTHVRIMSPVEYPKVELWRIAYKPTQEGEGFIEWGGLSEECKFVEVDVRACMSAFLELGDATDSKIYDFARKWGPLGVEVNNKKDERGCSTYVYREATETYRLYAREAQAILRLGTRLMGEAIPPITEEFIADWTALWPYRLAPPYGCQDIRFLRLSVGDAVTRWLNLSGVFPCFLWWDSDIPYCVLHEPELARQWDAEENWRHLDRMAGRDPNNPNQKTGLSYLPHPPHRPSRLLAILAMYLIATLASPKSMRLCTRCQRMPIQPERHKKVNLCLDCKKAAHAENQREYRLRQKAK